VQTTGVQRLTEAVVKSGITPVGWVVDSGEGRTKGRDAYWDRFTGFNTIDDRMFKRPTAVFRTEHEAVSVAEGMLRYYPRMHVEPVFVQGDDALTINGKHKLSLPYWYDATLVAEHTISSAILTIAYCSDAIASLYAGPVAPPDYA
jgi:hypothetical protein